MRFRKRRRSKNVKIIVITSICFLFIMTAGYAAFSTNINITAKGNVLEQDRVIQSWNQTSNEDFHTDYYKENIVSVTFLDNNNVPDKATESWNVSENKEKGGVMAWVIPNSDDSTKYDLYIGANGGVIANVDSSHLFYDFENLISIDFSDNFNTSNATNMERLFNNCYNLVSIIGLENFITDNVTSMFAIFHDCQSIESLDLSSFKTSRVVDMGEMFSFCYNLTNVNVSGFDTSNVTNMHSMFYFCYNLKEIDLSHFKTENVTDMVTMFWSCYKLEKLNLCSFDTGNVTSMARIFAMSSSLTHIYVGSNWTTSQADTTGMFLGSGVSSVTTGQC